MSVDAPAVVEPAQETERDFRRWVRAELVAVRKEQQHQTEQLKLIGAAMELLLKAQGLDSDD